MTFHREESWRVLLSASAAVAGIAGERCIVAPRRMWLVAAAMSSPFLSRFPFPSVSFTAFLPPGRPPAPPAVAAPALSSSPPLGCLAREGHVSLPVLLLSGFGKQAAWERRVC